MRHVASQIGSWEILITHTMNVDQRSIGHTTTRYIAKGDHLSRIQVWTAAGETPLAMGQDMVDDHGTVTHYNPQRAWAAKLMSRNGIFDQEPLYPLTLGKLVANQVQEKLEDEGGMVHVRWVKRDTLACTDAYFSAEPPYDLGRVILRANPNSKPFRETRFSDYKEVPGGVRFPSKSTMTSFGRNPIVLECTLAKAAVNVELPDSEFQLHLPIGTTVNDEIIGRTYVIDAPDIRSLDALPSSTAASLDGEASTQRTDNVAAGSMKPGEQSRGGANSVSSEVVAISQGAKARNLRVAALFVLGCIVVTIALCLRRRQRVV